MAVQGIQLRVPAQAEHVPALRHAVISFADAHCAHASDMRFAVALAVTEACTNVVRHAYPDCEGTLHLVVRLDDRHLTIEITDHGIGLGGDSDAKGLGLGLPLIDELPEGARITSDPTGTRVEMWFPRQS